MATNRSQNGLLLRADLHVLFDLHLLKINPRSLCVEIDPMALYRSYNRRQLAADFRLVAGAPGPRRTAEGYLMVALLDQQGE